MLETFRTHFPGGLWIFLMLASTSIMPWLHITHNLWSINSTVRKEKRNDSYYLLRPVENGVVINLTVTHDDVNHYFELQLP